MDSPAAAPDERSPPSPPPEPAIEFTFKDAKRLWSAVRHEEKVAEMEKRSLMESAKESTSEGSPKKQWKAPSIDKYVSLEKGLSKGSSVNKLLLSAIHKTLEVIDHMPVSVLYMVKRQLEGAQGMPQFRYNYRNGSKKNIVLGRVREKCDEFIWTLKKGDNLPKSFAKALSVMSLFLKLETKCADIPTSLFFSFSYEIKALQNDIIRAIWSLPMVQSGEIKGLQHIYDPESKSVQNFRRKVKRSLKECLYECCDEVDIPPDLRRTVDFIINMTYRRRKAAVRNYKGNVNSELKQVALELLQQEMPLSPSSESLESSDASESNDFDMSYNYGSRSDECNSYTKEAEGTGDSWLPHD